MFRPLTEQKSICFEVVNQASSRSVKCDFERILQVLSNLLGNAVKFTPPGGTITLLVVEELEGVSFSVKDTGSGISVEQLPHLFDRFWQADRHGRLGTGLGLSISKGIVEAHGFKLIVKSEQGRGSSFSFHLM